jgi:hypothetical protein
MGYTDRAEVVEEGGLFDLLLGSQQIGHRGFRCENCSNPQCMRSPIGMCLQFEE